MARTITFQPAQDGSGRTKVSFRLTEPDTVEVAIVDGDGELVRVLAVDVELEGGDTRHHFSWDREDEEGSPAPAGRYRLRLTLEDADRVATSGERLKIKGGGPAS